MSLDVATPPQRQAPEASAGESEPVPVVAADQRASRWYVAEHGAFLAIVLVWSLYVLPARGGWQVNVVPVACAAALIPLLVLRPWRHCATWLIAVACAPAAGAILVATLSPYGDGGPVSVSRWAYFALLVLATASYARTHERRVVALCVVLLAGLHQYAQAWVPWWGGDDGAVRVMTGTLYSANPFGGLMLTFALVAGCIAVLGAGRIRRLGWLVAPLCASGVFLSAARAAVLLLLAGTVVLAALAARKAGRAGLLRVVALVALSWVVLFGTTSSLFFEGGRGALAGVDSKDSTGQTVSSTSGIRVDFWTAAWGEWRDEPVVGGGVGSYSGDSRMRMAPGAQRSPFAHNEVLGSLAEGGVALGIPVLAALLAAGALFARPILNAARVSPPRADALQIAAGLGGGALLAHAMVDFPLSFPAILGLLGLLVGCCASGSTVGGRASRVRWGVLSLGVSAVVVSGLYVGISHDRAGVSGRASLDAVSAEGRVMAAPLPGVRDARVPIARAERLARQANPSLDAVRQAERELQPFLRLDMALHRISVDLLVLQGRDEEALELARWLAETVRGQAPILVSPLAERLLAAGSREQAFDVLAVEVYTRATEGGRMGLQLAAVLDRAYGLADRVEPGWSCSRQALLDSGVLTDDHPLALLQGAAVDGSTCDRWSAEASDILGARS